MCQSQGVSGDKKASLVRMTYFQSKLATVQNGALERVLFVLELGTCTLTRSEQVLENRGQQATTSL